MNLLKKLSLGRVLLISFLAIVVMFLAINYFTFTGINELTVTADIERRTIEVLEVLEEVIADLSDAETGQRGYLLTGDLKYLEPYNSGVFLVGTHIDNLQRLVKDDPGQQERILILRDLVEQKKAELQETVDLRSEDRFDEAIEIVLSDKGKDIMDDIRVVIGDMFSEEEELLEIRKIVATDAKENTRLIILFGSLVGFLTAVYLALFISRYIGRSIEILRYITFQITKGNMDVIIDTSGSNELAQLSGSIEIMRDSLKASLEDIVSEKEKLGTILQSIGDGVFVVDNNLNIIVYNNISAELSGFTVEEAIGKPYHEILHFVHEEDGKVNDKFIKEVFRTGEVQEMSNHTHLIKKDGSKIVVADSAAPLKNKNGEIIGAVMVFRDVSKERAIDKAKTEFVSLASHQLRTPLTSINWYTEMLLSGDAGKLSKDQEEFLNEIYTGNQRMVSLVNSLLNISRIDLGTFIINPEPVNFIEITDSVIDELMPLIEGKNIKIEKNYEEIPIISADINLTRIIFQNIISNSVKYTPKDGSISVSFKKQDKNVLFSVSDTGYGIPERQQSRIFEKLFRADNVQEKAVEGTGLGLYLVKSVVETAGGNIWFESKENKGTTFYITIPLSGMKKKEGTRGLS